MVGRRGQVAMGAGGSRSAREAGTLVQVSLDGTIPPMPFNQIQCADLQGWDGDSDTPGWRKLQAASRRWPGRRESGGAAGAERARKASVCVLPFANMSGDAEQEYFSDGISEDITTDLSKVSALAVIARNTAFMFKGQSVDVCEVARKLASATCSKAACARRASACGSPPS